MPCDIPRPYYIPWTRVGIRLAASQGDGYTIVLHFKRAFPNPSDWNLAYNIYYSTLQDEEIKEGPKYVSTNTDGLVAEIVDFSPGDTYYFIVRATQYDPSWYDLEMLPKDPGQITDTNIYIYPETLLSENINDEQLNIPVMDVDIFPNYGVIQIGQELIRYTSKDIPNNELIASERGFLNSEVRIHQIDGYDGYVQNDPILRFWKGYEEENLFRIQEQSSFNSANNIFTINDGYKDNNRSGILFPDLSKNDEKRSDFPALDLVGWRRTDPKLLFQGKCLDSYIGGENFCADGNNGVNQQIRNIGFEEQADRLQEFLLEQLGTGATCMLLRRRWDGKVCHCFTQNQEYPDARCSLCFNTGYITGYDQFFNPRRPDGRILVRFDPVPEDIKREDAGLESQIIFNCWTLAYPALKDSDVIIKFNPDGTEEFRYEILDVTRNALLYGETGNQKFRAQRIRKTSIIYQWRAIRSTADIPTVVTTTVGLLRGPLGSTPIPHTHTITINNGTMSLTQINQTTSVTEGHNHPIINGEVASVLQHSHNIILP